jgi:hypothetical protein
VGAGAAIIFSSTLPLAEEHAGLLLVPASLATVWTGFLMLTTRKKAIMQVLGYLLLENGIYLFGLLLLEAMPFLVEIGVLLSHHLGVPVVAFDSLGHDKAFLDSLGIPAPSLEGYLAPNTYEFLPGTSPEVAFRTMVGRQKEVLLKAAAGRDSLPLVLGVDTGLQWRGGRAARAVIYRRPLVVCRITNRE